MTLKALNVIHRLCRDGNESFLSMFKRDGGGRMFDVSRYNDPTHHYSYDWPFLREYAAYMSEKITTFQVAVPLDRISAFFNRGLPLVHR